ncbi:hypothetical protein PILCRDRAFT_15101 [Piloderma croceum F 1598]|uniref:Uncharacterized protein n=1 Tax=Piloderma croceum (strain F 1598) TaxID=765440 RepID=A0A0C3EM05_PILCF|nr:hypothetical protein PILCRDRAFT_15101 [Piloderma croceum F 1598]
MSTTATIVPLPGNDFMYNVTLYNVQELSTAYHTLDVALVDYILSTSAPSVASTIRFDYALVNNTLSLAVSPSASGAGTTCTSVPLSGGRYTGFSHVIAGSVVGGEGGVVVIVVIFFWIFRQRWEQPQHIAKFDPDLSIKNNIPLTPPAPQYHHHLSK